MERVNRILRHPLWLEQQEKIKKMEENRIFCCHQLSHLLDVARIAYCMALEQLISIPKEQIYAAALVHDIGRAIQYESGIPHEKAGLLPAETILADCGFGKTERQEILQAMQFHRNGSDETSALSSVLYQADKLSRPCFDCKAASLCYWDENKKNHGICY